jgi:tRNA(adenine34) deaminase
VKQATTDEQWMQEALQLAHEAEAIGEVPVGAVVVLNDRIIGRGFNQPIYRCDPSAHAEILALRDAAESVNNYRLIDCTLYVTIEPCTMCVGALVHSRVQRRVYGAPEPKAGAVMSQARLLDSAYLNHQIVHKGGICSETCSYLVRNFFAKRRC